MSRLQACTANRDPAISVTAGVAQLQALSAWGQKRPADLSVVQQPALIARVADDRMVPASHREDMARRLPNSELGTYPGAGHGGIFQHHEDFVPKELALLAS